MFSSNLTTKSGVLAGGIAMIAALLAMRFVSTAIGPRPLLTEIMAGITLQNLLLGTGEFVRFIFSGNARVRIVVCLIIVFLTVGAALGSWIGSAPYELRSRAIQSAAILFFVTITLMYLGDSRYLEWFLQEIAITLAVAFVVYAWVVHWLLQPEDSQRRWSIGGIIALVGAITLARDVWML